MKNIFRIAEISFGRSSWDAAYDFEYGGSRFEVQRFGTQFSVELVQRLIETLRNQVDAFALTSLPPVIKLNNKSYVHRQYLEIMGTPTSVPLCDGSGLREVSNINSLVKAMDRGLLHPSQGVFFPAAVQVVEIEEFLRHRYPESIYLGDAYSILGLPFLIQPFPGLMTLSKVVFNFANMKDLHPNIPQSQNWFSQMSRSLLLSQAEKIQYICGDLPSILLFDSAAEFIRGKDLIISSHHPVMEKEVQKFGPRSIINLFPVEFKFSPYVNYSVLDAVLRLSHGKTAPLSIEEWEHLLSAEIDLREVARQYALTRHVSAPAQISQGFNKIKNKILKKPVPDFAFIIHALSHKDFTRLPGMKILNLMPEKWNDSFDRTIAKMPAVVYGEIKHVISESNGREVNGLIYGLFATPKVLKEADPEVTYRKIEGICYDAANRGVKIMGLGAYTKIVGDQGVTINQNSPIPVTTGNSLSASATLWGLYEVVRKMRLLHLDINGRINGFAMVIGATGSIGKVSAKLLSMTFSKLCLVAPRINRLQELREEIRQISPHCEVWLTTSANELASEMDVLVTATSAFDHKIVDVMLLKPGCVVCDCSRPLDFELEDAKKRPDVLIVESGEVILPGPVELTCDLGLPSDVVYACLAETALLSLEQQYESFTMGRDIEWSKVKQIYKLARKHGVKLAAIQGHMGTITDHEIEMTRELAISRIYSGKIR